MPTLTTVESGPPNVLSLSAAQTGTGPSTNVADRGAMSDRGAAVVITTTVGSTPTCTYAIQGSVDGTNWFPLEYADSATPATVVTTTFAITSATTKTLLLPTARVWRYLRINYSANTNVTNTADAYI